MHWMTFTCALCLEAAAFLAHNSSDVDVRAGTRFAKGHGGLPLMGTMPAGSWSSRDKSKLFLGALLSSGDHIVHQLSNVPQYICLAKSLAGAFFSRGSKSLSRRSR